MCGWNPYEYRFLASEFPHPDAVGFASVRKQHGVSVISTDENRAVAYIALHSSCYTINANGTEGTYRHYWDTLEDGTVLSGL